MTDAQWDELFIPINMAFFFHSTPAGKIVALYPSPGGATESSLTLDTWGEIVEQNAVLATMQPDVEALLVKRLNRGDGSGAPEYYLAPIDQCYKLVGLFAPTGKVCRAVRRFGTQSKHSLDNYGRRLSPMLDLNFQVEGANRSRTPRRHCLALQATCDQRGSRPAHS